MPQDGKLKRWFERNGYCGWSINLAGDLFSFQGMQNIKWLRLSHNSLNYLDTEAFAGLFTLTRLSLDHNELQFFPSETMTRWATWHVPLSRCQGHLCSATELHGTFMWTVTLGNQF